MLKLFCGVDAGPGGSIGTGACACTGIHSFTQTHIQTNKAAIAPVRRSLNAHHSTAEHHYCRPAQGVLHYDWLIHVVSLGLWLQTEEELSHVRSESRAAIDKTSELSHTLTRTKDTYTTVVCVNRFNTFNVHGSQPIKIIQSIERDKLTEENGRLKDQIRLGLSCYRVCSPCT